MKSENSDITLLGAACCIGAQDKRCELGPDRIKQLDIVHFLSGHNIQAHWGEILRAENPEGGQMEVIESICTRLATQTFDLSRNDEKFVVFGGDHSCAIGTWSGVAASLPGEKQMGLIWVDAHMDSHLPETTPSGAIHGMPLACLLGHGDQRLRHIALEKQKLLPQNVCLIGIRSFEHEEAALLDVLGVKVFSMQTVIEKGLNTVWQEAVEYVSTNTECFGVTIDLDAIDPADAPGVGSPEAHGIKGSQLVSATHALANNQKFIGAEIAEYNPILDENDKTAELAMRLVASMFARGNE